LLLIVVPNQIHEQLSFFEVQLKSQLICIQ